MPTYLTYPRFYDQEQSKELTDFLDRERVPYIIEKDREVLDKIYVGETLDPLIRIMIKSEDFAKVNDLMITRYPVDLAQLDTDYYLFSFSNSELQEVLSSPDNWNYLDRAIAAKLLEGKQLTNTNISQVAETVDPAPEQISAAWLIAQYLLSLVFPYVGILIGIATLAAYRTTPDGKKRNIYNANTRMHAKIMLGIGIIRALIPLILP